MAKKYSSFLVIGGQKRGYLHSLYTYTTMNNTYVCFYTEIIDFNIKIKEKNVI